MLRVSNTIHVSSKSFCLRVPHSSQQLRVTGRVLGDRDSGSGVGAYASISTRVTVLKPFKIKGYLASALLRSVDRAQPALYTTPRSRGHSISVRPRYRSSSPLSKMRTILLLLATAAASANHIIHPCFDASCAHWNDTKGERIESHAAGMLRSPTDKRWYWYGESKKTADLSDHGVNCYSALDIAGPWTNEGSVLGQSQVKIPGKTGPFVIERPKVIYNAATKTFVMWFHLTIPATR